MQYPTHYTLVMSLEYNIRANLARFLLDYHLRDLALKYACCSQRLAVTVWVTCLSSKPWQWVQWLLVLRLEIKPSRRITQNIFGKLAEIQLQERNSIALLMKDQHSASQPYFSAYPFNSGSWGIQFTIGMQRTKRWLGTWLKSRSLLLTPTLSLIALSTQGPHSHLTSCTLRMS